MRASQAQRPCELECVKEEGSKRTSPSPALHKNLTWDTRLEVDAAQVVLDDAIRTGNCEAAHIIDANLK
ncbi:hypothetical protein PC118_g11510 [Phytophthora cactorum]|uniref:Uncharacterized protein n=1 Tax=Phytophthora cactorum TaxID=29920 RepID=A0A8T0Z0Z2_9STRA|nr:hypothetical protein PC112_g11671 [Phytophthora cactorum]KAG2822682.1 hypothetical protein PC111_g10536 [Phytophthora cactorum]KAG2855716.1 hypothetical protein PC113_g12205 [Phytophthora cactorum]KAG2902066.1 hypothetical protein PC114_g12888 [Phytophthora cactorum]KAG2935119.1 hypothetical protein PC117_g12464 [Phytophthora cactorum]